MLKLAEAAARLNLSVKHLRKWIDAGYVKAVRYPTGQYRIPESEVKRLTTAS